MKKEDPFSQLESDFFPLPSQPHLVHRLDLSETPEPLLQQKHSKDLSPQQ
jgi:hypothetical protein